MSTWELAYFYYAEWSPHVIDIREQYPLFEVAETEAIARQCGIRYPRHPAAHTPLVMTTDFLVTIRQQGQLTRLAQTIKPRADLSKRTLEKFEIERRFWAARDVSWQIVTDQELSPSSSTICTNSMPRIFLIRTGHPDLLAATTAMLTVALHAPTNALATLALACDRRLGQPPGTSLGMIYHLVATKRWEANLFTALDPARVFTLGAEGATLRLLSL